MLMIYDFLGARWFSPSPEFRTMEIVFMDICSDYWEENIIYAGF
jgi:hypothetical protein